MLNFHAIPAGSAHNCSAVELQLFQTNIYKGFLHSLYYNLYTTLISVKTLKTLKIQIFGCICYIFAVPKTYQ